MGKITTDPSRRHFLSLMATGGFAAGLPSVATAASDKDAGPYSRLAIQAGWTLTMQAGEIRPEQGISVIVSGGSIEDVTERKIPADVQHLALPPPGSSAAIPTPRAAHPRAASSRAGVRTPDR